jgi:hypothetical protein
LIPVGEHGWGALDKLALTAARAPWRSQGSSRRWPCPRSEQHLRKLLSKALGAPGAVERFARDPRRHALPEVGAVVGLIKKELAGDG